MHSLNRRYGLFTSLMSLMLIVSFFVSTPVNHGLAAPAAQVEGEPQADPPETTADHTVYLPLVIKDSPNSDEAPLFTYTIDPTVAPTEPTIPGWDDVPPRPLAAIQSPGGSLGTFVANELVLQSDQPGELNSILQQYNGEVIYEVDPAAQGLPDVPHTYLIRVDLATADLDQFAADVQALDGGSDSRASGEHLISSDDGARLLAIASASATEGLPVAVNWVGETDDLPDASREAAAGQTVGGVAYSPDVYDWIYMAAGTTQDIGVPEAWSALQRAGRLENRVKIAILDKGFAPHTDFPTNTQFISVIPGANARGTRGSSRSPWHGTHVFETAMARFDNNFGVAGTGAPVADPILIYTGYDYITSIAAVIAARAAGADIISMSYSADIPAVFAWTGRPFEATTAAVRLSGTLLFASASNDGKDVDDLNCFIVCWESELILPCEANGVICVGGLGWNTRNADGGSNHGSRGGVQIFAPYNVYRGPNPDSTGAGERVGLISGTSFATPYTAGVAALVWAADPTLSANAVWSILRDTAHSSPDPEVPRYVNAQDAVRDTIGTGVSADITSPIDGATYEQGGPIALQANVGFVTNRTDLPVVVRWLVNGRQINQQTFTPGAGSHTIRPTSVSGRDLLADTYAITLRVTAGTQAAEEELTITVRNSPPTASVTQPAVGTAFCAAETVLLRGQAGDINELSGLPDSAYSWRSDRDGALGTGARLSVTGLSEGNHTLTLTVTDNGGLTAEDTVTITIRSASDPACTDLPPNVVITAPEDDGFTFDTRSDGERTYTTVTIIGDVSDPEDPATSLTVEILSDVDGDLGVPSISPAGEVRLSARLYVRPEQVGTGGTLHTITMRVTDSDGNVREDTVRYTVATLF